MKRQLILNKATRIEGNASIHVEIDRGRVQNARFMVADFRGFEKLSQGKQAAYIPHIVSRICGLCCMSHQAASVQAIEDALEIPVPESVRRLRQAAVYGEWIASHALSYFFLTQPDVLGTDEGIFGMIKDHPRIAETAFAIQKAGSRIVAILGGRSVHPVAMCVGGMSMHLTKSDLQEIAAIADHVAQQALGFISSLERRTLRDRRIAFPRDSKVNFLCHDANSGPNGHIKVFSPDGTCEDQFDISTFEDHVSEMRVDWSFAKFPYLTRLGFPDGIFHVGPLARAFSDGSATQMPALADHEIIQRARSSKGIHIEYVDIVRLAEIYGSATRIKELVQDIDLSEIATESMVPSESGKGIAVVEAPRGVLMHSYTINRGKIERLKLLVATQFNNPLINLIIKDLAEQHLDSEGLSESGQRAITRCIRLFDPCLTCATH